MTKGQNTLGTPARLDWFTLSEDLEAVFVAARRICALARLADAEQVRTQATNDARQVRAAWSDVNYLLAGAAADLDSASGRLSAKASTVLGIVLEAEDREQ